MDYIHDFTLTCNEIETLKQKLEDISTNVFTLNKEIGKITEQIKQLEKKKQELYQKMEDAKNGKEE